MIWIKFKPKPNVTFFHVGPNQKVIMKTENIDCMNCASRGNSIFCHLDKIVLSDIAKQKVMNSYIKDEKRLLEFAKLSY